MWQDDFVKHYSINVGDQYDFIREINTLIQQWWFELIKSKSK